VAWREDDDHAFLTGPAVCVYDGELDEAWLTSASMPSSHAAATSSQALPS
jgi:hypothetical protein